MNGARRLAIDWVSGRIRPGSYVLDVGCGDRQVGDSVIAPTKVIGIDMRAVSGARSPDHLLDLGVKPWPSPPGVFDAVIASYSLQHFGGGEAAAWSEIGRLLKEGGILVALGRYRADAPALETERADPLRSDSRATFEALALASGLEVTVFRLFKYGEATYQEAPPGEANAFAAVATKVRSVFERGY